MDFIMTAVRDWADTETQADPDDPRAWLASTPLLDLEDPRLRMKVQSLTQLCKSPRDKAITVYGYVKRLTLCKPIKMRFRTAREVLEAGCGDADDKATLLVALLRGAGIPARLRYVELRGDMLRGLGTHMRRAARPVVELWLGRWIRTDTFIFDASYMAAARARLRDCGWRWGYGICVDGATLWNGANDAFLGGEATEVDPMVLRDLGAFNDPHGLMASPVWRLDYRRFARAAHWAVVAPAMDRVIRELRAEASLGAVAAPIR
jgi:hypothetical protein